MAKENKLKSIYIFKAAKFGELKVIYAEVKSEEKAIYKNCLITP